MSTKHNPRFVFFGTPQMSVTVLNALLQQKLLPALIVTAPDKPRGRGLEFSPSPVKTWALEHEVEIAQPETLKDAAFVEELRNTDWDVFIVAAYAKLIPPDILNIPRRGCLNVHPSLLPAFRGPSPVISAILADERETGVSIMLMNEKMDEGPIVAQAKIEIDEREWPLKNAVLEEMLAEEGGNLLAEALPQWIAEKIPAVPQDDAAATYTKKFSDEAALVDIEGSAREALLKIHAFDRNPKAHFFTEKENKKIRVNIVDALIRDGNLEILRVIPEGKKEMDYAEFVRSSRSANN